MLALITTVNRSAHWMLALITSVNRSAHWMLAPITSVNRSAPPPHRRSLMGSRQFSSPGRWSFLRTPFFLAAAGRKTHAAHD